jgi:hypothetical protein
LLPCPGRGRPTNPWLVGPVAQCYKEWVGATARSTRFTAPTHTRHPTNTNRPEGALERREAPPPPPPRPSFWIRRTRCHRPTLDRIVRDPVVPEPALHPLRQAAAAPATSTREMASDSALPSNPDGLRPRFPPVYLSSCFRCSRSRSRCPCCLSVIIKYIPERIDYWCLCMFKYLRSNTSQSNLLPLYACGITTSFFSRYL